MVVIRFIRTNFRFTYGAMNRIYKHYFFDTNEVPARKSSFASYPGSLASQDDFYMMDRYEVKLPILKYLAALSCFKLQTVF